MDHWGTLYEPEDNDYVPFDQWGRDHWSTLAYLETRAVDANGEIDNRRMRCDPRLHREFAHSSPFITSGKSYPTRLADGSELADHDDWSCAEDMVAAGLIRLYFRERGSGPFGHGQARVEFTEAGFQLAAAIRVHKAAGGGFATFQSA